MVFGRMYGASSAGTADGQRRLLETYARADSTIRVEGNYPEALDLSVAVIYGSFNDVDHAIVYNRLAYPLARKLRDTRFAELALTNLAQSYREKQDFDNASRTTDSLLNLDFRNSRTLMFHYSIIKGELALQQGRNAEALRYFLKADSAANAAALTPYEKSAPLELMAAYYEKTGQPDSQLVCLNRGGE